MGTTFEVSRAPGLPPGAVFRISGIFGRFGSAGEAGKMVEGGRGAPGSTSAGLAEGAFGGVVLGGLLAVCSGGFGVP